MTRAVCERVGVLGRGVGIDRFERRQQGAVLVARAQVRQHLVVEDLLALGVGQVRGLVSGSCVETDATVAADAGLALLPCRVPHDCQAVVEARASDAPLVDQGDRVCIGRFLGRAGLVLGVDDDLGAGALLDAGDDVLVAVASVSGERMSAKS